MMNPQNQTSILLTTAEQRALTHAAVIGMATQSIGFGPEDLEGELFDFSQAEFDALQSAHGKLMAGEPVLFVAL